MTPEVEDTTKEDAEETESQVISDIRERGRKRLAVATNAAAWAIYGNDDDEQVVIDPKDVAMSEVVAIRVLTQLREGGLIDNEPLLGLATTRELLEELRARGTIVLNLLLLQPSTSSNEGASYLHYYAVKALEDVPDDVLNYATEKKKPIVGETTNDDGDDAKKEKPE